jgi:hypothetical protein
MNLNLWEVTRDHPGRAFGSGGDSEYRKGLGYLERAAFAPLESGESGVSTNWARAETGPFARIHKFPSQKRDGFAEVKMRLCRTEPGFVGADLARAETSDFRGWQNGLLMTGRFSGRAKLGPGKILRKPVALGLFCGIDSHEHRNNYSTRIHPASALPMTIIDFSPYLPAFTVRGVTSLQFVDAADRMVSLLLHAESGLPASETGLRQIVSEVESGVRDLDERLGAVRTSKYTIKKKAAHEARLKCFTALRSGAQGIVNDPDTTTPTAMRELAGVVLEPVARLGAGLRDKTRAEASTALRLLFKECDKAPVQAALTETGLLRFYRLLQGAHQEYVHLLREEGLPETDSEADADPERTGDPAGAVAANAAAVTTIPSPVPGTTGVTQRQLKDGILELLGVVFKSMAFHAANGREPFRHLLAECGDIAQEINSDAKLRETRAKKSEEKKAAKTRATGTATEAPADAAPTAPGDRKSTTSPVPAVSAPEASAPVEVAQGEGLNS